MIRLRLRRRPSPGLTYPRALSLAVAVRVASPKHTVAAARPTYGVSRDDEDAPSCKSPPLQGCSSPNPWKTRQAVKRSIETSSAMRGPRKFCQINFQNICKLAHDLQADNGPPPSPAYC